MVNVDDFDVVHMSLSSGTYHLWANSARMWCLLTYVQKEAYMCVCMVVCCKSVIRLDDVRRFFDVWADLCKMSVVVGPMKKYNRTR